MFYPQFLMGRLIKLVKQDWCFIR